MENLNLDAFPSIADWLDINMLVLAIPACAHPRLRRGSLWLGTAYGGKGMPDTARDDLLRVSAPMECQATSLQRNGRESAIEALTAPLDAFVVVFFEEGLNAFCELLRRPQSALKGFR